MDFKETLLKNYNRDLGKMLENYNKGKLDLGLYAHVHGLTDTEKKELLITLEAMNLKKIMEDVNVELSSEYRFSGKLTEEGVLKLLEKLDSSDVYVDDHSSIGQEEKIQGFAILRNGYICPLVKDTYFCLNPFYIDEEDDKIHLSTMSVAGNLVSKNISLVEAIENYNNDLYEHAKKVNPHRLFKPEEFGKAIVGYKIK